MNTWVERLAQLLANDTPAVLVTVAATRGSTPRAAGARMIVTANTCHDTIGGGQLERRAIAIARQLIAEAVTTPTLVRFPLGASVGQCCGGVVQLAFEPVGMAQRTWVETACTLTADHRRWGRVVPLGDATSPTIVFDENLDAMPFAPSLIEHARTLLNEPADTALLLGHDDNPHPTRLLDVSIPPELEVVLLGAGHVGGALADVFGRLPMRVRWIDTRESAFPPQVARNIEICCTDTPEAEVRAAPANTIFLVLTHSHALDFDLVRAILDRADFRFCGLIGSQSKRVNFEHRLRARGYAEHIIARLHCPIGTPHLPGKEPEVIAIAVAAQILQYRVATRAARDTHRHRAA